MPLPLHIKKFDKFGDSSVDIDYNSKTDVFRDLIYLTINQCEPRRSKDASVGHFVFASRAAQASEARLWYSTRNKQRFLVAVKTQRHNILNKKLKALSSEYKLGISRVKLRVPTTFQFLFNCFPLCVISRQLEMRFHNVVLLSHHLESLFHPARLVREDALLQILFYIQCQLLGRNVDSTERHLAGRIQEHYVCQNGVGQVLTALLLQLFYLLRVPHLHVSEKSMQRSIRVVHRQLTVNATHDGQLESDNCPSHLLLHIFRQDFEKLIDGEVVLLYLEGEVGTGEHHVSWLELEHGLTEVESVEVDECCVDGAGGYWRLEHRTEFDQLFGIVSDKKALLSQRNGRTRFVRVQVTLTSFSPQLQHVSEAREEPVLLVCALIEHFHTYCRKYSRNRVFGTGFFLSHRFFFVINICINCFTHSNFI